MSFVGNMIGDHSWIFRAGEVVESKQNLSELKLPCSQLGRFRIVGIGLFIIGILGGRSCAEQNNEFPYLDRRSCLPVPHGHS